MNFSEKIDIVLKANELGLNTIEEIESHCSIGAKTLRKNYNEGTEPTRRILVKLFNGLGINQQWWDDGKGEIFKENGTPAMKSTDNTEKRIEEIYRNIVEGNTEYILIPRSVLQEKYRLVSLEQFEKEREEMDKDKRQLLASIEEAQKKSAHIDALLLMNKELIASLTSLRGAGQPIKLKEAK